MSEYLIVLTTFPNRLSAKDVADKLLQDGLAACIQFDTMESFYLWDAEVKNEDEIRAMIKINAKHYENVEKIIKALHPYDVPQILALKVHKGQKQYLDWIDEVT